MGTFHSIRESLITMNTFPYPMSSVPHAKELIKTANAIVAAGKGILAADESTGTIGKRFDNISVENTEPNRRAYRELLFTTEGLEQYISGVIMYEETLFQSASDGKSFVDVLQSKGIVWYQSRFGCQNP